MRSPFDGEMKRAAVRPKITDNKGREAFESALSGIVDSQSAAVAYRLADQKRLGSIADQHQAAHTYLGLAFRLIEAPSISVDVDGDKIPATRMLHFAGHAFREIGQLNRAADAYWRAGVTSNKNGSPDPFGIRSLARAKSCCADIGEDDRSDEMHVLEWEARRLGSERPTPILTLWRITSRYGTSLGAWLASLALLLGVFTLLYEALHASGWLCDTQPWTFLLTAAYYCAVTTATVGYGEIVPSHWASQLVVVLNIALAYALLATGATILGRKVLGR